MGWRRLALSLALAAACASPRAQGNDKPFFEAAPGDSPRIARLRKAPSAAVVAAFWDEVRRGGAPLVEPVAGEPKYSWLTFLWRATEPTSNVVVIDGVAAGVGGTEPRNSMLARLARTDVWYRTYKVRNDAAFTYTLSPNDSLQPLLGPRRSRPRADPLNPNLSGPQSSVTLASAPRRTEPDAATPVPNGTVTAGSISSSVLGNTRALQIYTPPGFAASQSGLPLLVVLDSGAYGDYVPVPAILDALIAEKRIAPVVAVMVGNVSRTEELQCSPAYASFLARELVPWMRETYRAGASPALTVVSGASLGGLAASFAAFQHPDVFGNVVSQSGSYWWAPAGDAAPEWLTRRLAAESPKAVRVSMSVGAMEIPEQLETNRRFREALAAKGYAVSYSEFNGNHSYLNWRADLADHLARLIGPPR
jgi:enterochelin esterase-like enzyme